jgi:hypothetical protein
MSGARPVHRKQWLKNSCCTGCGGQRDEPGFRMCSSCRRKNADRVARQRRVTMPQARVVLDAAVEYVRSARVESANEIRLAYRKLSMAVDNYQMQVGV